MPASGALVLRGDDAKASSDEVRMCQALERLSTRSMPSVRSRPGAAAGAAHAAPQRRHKAHGPGYRGLLRGPSPPDLTAYAILLGYVRNVVGHLPAGLITHWRAAAGNTMEIDGPTLRGLEVLTSASGRDGSLLSIMDRTVTASGAKLLGRQLSAPLADPRTIERRLAMVRRFVDEPSLLAGCREALGGMPDVLRACGHLSLGKGGPGNLALVCDRLDRAAVLAGLNTTLRL